MNPEFMTVPLGNWLFAIIALILGNIFCISVCYSIYWVFNKIVRFFKL